MMLRWLAVCGVVMAAGCARATAPLPRVPSTQPTVLDARALAVYRTVADSIYVHTTDRPIAIVATTMDTTCTTSPCVEISQRWGLSSLWWSDADSSEASSARQSLLERSGSRFDLRAVPATGGKLLSIDESRVPIAGSDVAPWIAFRDGNSLAAGALHFSGVGFGESGQTAIVFVDWRCGPACGHTLSVSLRATSDSTWRIGDMLLLTSQR
ncbi:MAG: hypothetical protein V4617_10425 [Gemmatimonadota bacterium]